MRQQTVRGVEVTVAADQHISGYHCGLALVAARRGDPDVWPHLDAAMTAADGSTGPMYIGAVRLARAEARWLESDLTAARQESELADDACADATDPWLNGEIAVWLRRTGSPRTSQRELAEPYRLQLTGNHRGAAELFDALGCPTTRRSRCSMRLTIWRCDERSTSAMRSGPSRRRGSFARRCARSASDPFRADSEPRRARIRSA